MIALIGFMGAGKSTVSVVLAERLGWERYETDKLVADKAGVDTMQAVFDKGGEALARPLEQQVLSEIDPDQQAVIDCGGGIITYPPSLKQLETLASKIILLRVPFEVSKQRVGNSPFRPLFRDTTAAEKLYKEREALYEATATDIIDVADQTPEAVADKIMELL